MLTATPGAPLGAPTLVLILTLHVLTFSMS